LRFDAVLFDLGGTLINYENEYSWKELAYLGCRNAAAFLEKSFGIQLSPERLAEKFLTTLDDMLKSGTEDMAEVDIYRLAAEVLGHFEVNSVDGLPAKFVGMYYEPTTAQITLESGAVEILTKIKSAGLKIGLVSNSIFPADFHRHEMNRFGILGFFDFTIFSSEFGIRKPSREIYQKALNLAGSKPERAIFIGDRMLEDVAGPQQSGLRAILKYSDRREYSSGAVPYRTIRKLDELEKIMFE